MNGPSPLCVLPPEPPAGCCDPPPRLPAAPLRIDNPPGLSVVRYRIGTFTSFRRAMLDELAGRRPPDPLAGWREGTAGDYLTTLVELWAYLADVLTFYQERIANEALLPTATQRDSLLQLARLIDYHAGPGAAAGVLVAFTVEKDKSLMLPAGFRVGSKAAAGQPAAVFETEAALAAPDQHSAIPLSAVAPTNQFARLSDYISLVPAHGIDPALIGLAASAVYGGAGATYALTLISSPFLDEKVAAAATIKSGTAPNPAARRAAVFGPSSSTIVNLGIDKTAFVTKEPSRSYAVRFFLDQTTRPVVLKGTNTRLAVGDYLLVVEGRGEAGEKQTLRQAATVQADKATDTTTVTWTEEPGSSYANVTLFALRVSAAPFGSSAPAWNTLSPTLTNSDGKNPNAPYKNNWDDPSNAASAVPQGKVLHLDAVYADARGTPDNPGWVVLLSDDPKTQPAVFHVTDARSVTATGFTLNTKVTRLTLDKAVTGSQFPLRNTVVLTGAEELTLQNNLPLPEPLAGKTLVLAGLYPLLEDGQTVVLRGKRFNVDAHQATAETAAEPGTLAGPPVVDALNNLTTVTLRQPLARPYARAGAELLANVVEATHGETVREEVLGSGDGSAFQTFPLKKKPLTYLPAGDGEGLSAVQSTLRVTVNGVRWDERPTLADSTPDGPHYTTARDDAGRTSIVFGDGFFGARPPTGRDNVRARYRYGLGASGNVAAGAVAQLLDSTAGLQKVANPLPSLGGADPEGVEQLRANAPASLRTFGRAVSAADYAALALSYPGVAKAAAAWVLRDPETLRALPQPYVRLIVATPDQAPLAEQTAFARGLRSFLDRRRDPNVPLRLADFIPAFLDVAAEVEVDDRFPREATVAAVRAALAPGVNPDGRPGFFAFERLQFGQDIHLSAVYAALQAVPGVRDATVTALRRPDLDPDPRTVRDDVFLRPTELAVVRAGKGAVTITWRAGGFVDT